MTTTTKQDLRYIVRCGFVKKEFKRLSAALTFAQKLNGGLTVTVHVYDVVDGIESEIKK